MKPGITKLRGPRNGKLTEDVLCQAQPLNAPEDVPVDEIPLHRFDKKYVPTTALGLKNEQPWHRMAAYMIVAGNTNKQVAEAAGVATAYVSQLRAQRWFQELLARIAQETGRNILSVVTNEALASIQTLVEIRDSGESERNRLSAAIHLLEQSVGKPTQKIIADVKPTLPPDKELEEIERELQHLRGNEPPADSTGPSSSVCLPELPAPEPEIPRYDPRQETLSRID